MSNTSPSSPPQRKGDCGDCRGTGRTGMYQEACNYCDGTGYIDKIYPRPVAKPQYMQKGRQQSKSFLDQPQANKTIDELLPCISCGSQADPADGFGTCTCGNEQIRQDIQALITEAYKKGYVDSGIKQLKETQNE